MKKDKDNEKVLLTIKEASELLHVSYQTLRKWDAIGRLRPIRTIGNHRRWKKSDLMDMIGEDKIKATENSDRRFAVTYARCSSNEQKDNGDIERQSARITEYAVKNGYYIKDIIKDCGSGLNESRRGYLKLLDLVSNRQVDKVIVENKDRLTRFGFDTLVYFFRRFDVEIEVVDKCDNLSPEKEIT